MTFQTVLVLNGPNSVLVRTDDALIRDYGIRIPVVTVDGEERFEISVDPAVFRVAVEA